MAAEEQIIAAEQQTEAQDATETLNAAPVGEQPTTTEDASASEKPYQFKGFDEIDDDGGIVEDKEQEVQPVAPQVQYVGLADTFKDLGDDERKALQYAAGAKTLPEMLAKLQEYAQYSQPIDVSKINVTEYGNETVREIIAADVKKQSIELGLSEDDIQDEIEAAVLAFEDLPTKGAKLAKLRALANTINEERKAMFANLDGNILGQNPTAQQEPIQIPELTRDDVSDYLLPQDFTVERIAIKDGEKKLLQISEADTTQIQKSVIQLYEQDLANNTHFVNGKWVVDAAFKKDERKAFWEKYFYGQYLYDNREALFSQTVKRAKDATLKEAGIGAQPRRHAVTKNIVGGNPNQPAADDAF